MVQNKSIQLNQQSKNNQIHYHSTKEHPIGYNSMTRITNTILSPSIPNPQNKIYLNGPLTLITPNRPSRCVSWNYNHPIGGYNRSCSNIAKIVQHEKYHPGKFANLTYFCQYYARKVDTFFSMLVALFSA